MMSAQCLYDNIFTPQRIMHIGNISDDISDDISDNISDNIFPPQRIMHIGHTDDGSSSIASFKPHMSP